MDYSLLKKICDAPGPSGHEHAAQKVVIEEMRDYCDDVFEDRMCNIIGVKKATKKTKGKKPLKVVLAAHVDEFGFLVRHINGDGFITVSMISGAAPAILMGHQIAIYGKKKKVIGVLAPKPGADKDLKIEDLLIDTGMPKEWVEEHVSIGDIGTLNINLTKINDKTVVTRNFDDRLGTYCMVKALQELKDLSVDLYCVSTVQEEVGCRGIPVAAAVIEADIGLAIDGGCCIDAYNKDMHCNLGTGAAIYVKDNITFGHHKLLDFLYAMCDKEGIPYTKTYNGGTDAGQLQRTGSGTLATTVGAPTRYMHSSVQMANVDDIDATTALIKRFVETAHKLLPNSNPWQSVK